MLMVMTGCYKVLTYSDMHARNLVTFFHLFTKKHAVKMFQNQIIDAVMKTAT